MSVPTMSERLRAQALAKISPAGLHARRFKLNITASVSGHGAMRVARTIEGTALEVAHQLAAEHVIAADKNSVALFSVGVLRDDLKPGESVSTLAALAGVQCVVLDFDHVTHAQVIRAQAALEASGLVYLMYSTHSWTLDAPRWRIMVFLSRVVLVERYAALWEGLGQLVGTPGDEAAKKPAQRFYLSSCSPGEEGNRPAAIVGGTRLADPNELDPPAQIQAQTGHPIKFFDHLKINDDALAKPQREDNRNRDAGLIAKDCGMVAAFAAGESVAEPVWRAILGVYKFCLDGERLWHEDSAKDPVYDRAQTQTYWDRYDAGPTRCGAALQCGQCKHNGKLSSPVQLGDVINDAPLKANPDNVQALQEAVTAGGLQFVMDQDGQLNCVVTTQTATCSARTVLNANSVAADDAILDMASAAGKPLSDRAIENFKARKRNAARQRGEAVPVYLRAAEIHEVIYVDRGPGRIVRIAGTGVQLVDDVADGVPLFRRGMGVGQLPNPELFDTCETALRFAMGTFKAQFGLTTGQALITVAILLEWHRSRTPHPIFEAVGPAGSGKSTLADFVLSLIDPAGDGGRVTIGTGGPDIAAAAQQRYVLPLDNAGKMDKATSDMLCIVSTGGTLLVRLLYSNGETANLKLHRPVLITAVSPVCVAPDLQSRVVRIELPARQGDYKAEGELRRGLDTLRPRMLGALYTLLSGALRELPSVCARDGWGHRQVDFDQMGEAMIAAAGAKPGTFGVAVGQMRERMARRTASGDLFLMALCAVLRKVAVKPTHTGQLSLNAVLKLNPQMSVLAYGDNRIEVTARPGALHKLLPLSYGGFGRDSAMPATERGLADAVRRVQPLLHGIGIDVLELASGSRPLLRFDFAAGVVHED